MTFGNSIIDLLLPRRCILCKAPTLREVDLCYACERDLPKIISSCQNCGQPLSINQTHCGLCLHQHLPYSQLIAAFHYRDPIAHLLTALKFNHKLGHAILLGELLGQHLYDFYQGREKPEIIIPIPLHQQRLKERGYNQALEIAKPVAKKLGIAIDRYNCIRSRNTIAQTLLAAEQRKQNIKQAFVIDKPINHKYAGVIDDVVTTGSTVTEFCKTLHQNGITNIDVWCCAYANSAN